MKRKFRNKRNRIRKRARTKMKRYYTMKREMGKRIKPTATRYQLRA